LGGEGGERRGGREEKIFFCPRKKKKKVGAYDVKLQLVEIFETCASLMLAVVCGSGSNSRSCISELLMSIIAGKDLTIDYRHTRAATALADQSTSRKPAGINFYHTRSVSKK